MSVLALSEGDARLFIEIIDRVYFSRTFFGVHSLIFPLDAKAFRAAKLETELRQIAFVVLRKLCGKTGYLPKSYLLSDKFDLSGLPHASGGFADVRMGVFKGKDVSVKTLRVSGPDDGVKIRKVGDQAKPSLLDSLIRHTALLQGSCYVEELVPSQRPQSNRHS